MRFAHRIHKTKEKSAKIQTKLTIGQPGDKYEEEADAMADKVMRMPEGNATVQRQCEDCEEEALQMKPLSDSVTPLIQKQGAEEEEEMLQMQPMEEEEEMLQMQPVEEEEEMIQMQPMEEEEEMLQPKSEGGNINAPNALSSQLSQTKGTGSQLQDYTNQQMSTAFGTDFSNVNIHTDPKAVQMNQSLGARAFTHGSDIYFNKGEYNPDSGKGKHLLAHELTHVVQQSQVPSSNTVQRVLSPEARGIMKDTIIDEMQTTHTDFDVGAVQAERDITAAAQADAETAKVIFGIGMALIVPGFGGVLSRVGAMFGVTITENTANVVGGAIGEAAKSAGNSIIDQNHSSHPRRFFSAITSGFEAAQRHKKNWLRENVNNTSALPDNVLQDLNQYWTQLASNNESSDWATWFRDQWDRFQAQVGAIGPQGTGMVPYGPTPLSNDNIPARIRLESGGTRLALINETRVDFTSTWEWMWGESDIRTRYRFLTWIDDDLAGAATGRVSSVPTLNESQVTEMPD